MNIVDSGRRHFACTQCGACCDRAPEVELSEAAALADVFVFRLLFRMYSLPKKPRRELSETAESFYEKKRLMASHAARSFEGREGSSSIGEKRTQYLMISALAVSTNERACSALAESACSIHERRPLSCRTVPFHYSRGDSLALGDFDAFISRDGYRCDVSDAAPVVTESGRIVDQDMLQARADAAAVAREDIRWKQAIVAAMKKSNSASLPSIRDVEKAATTHAITTSMRIGWEIAAMASIIDPRDASKLVGLQLSTIERALKGQSVAIAERQTLLEMQAEYARALAS